MRIRRIRSWLWIGSAAMGLGAVGAVVLGWSLPYAEPEPMAAATPVNVKTEPAGGRGAGATMPPVNDPVWATPLRRPLVDPPAPPKKTAAPVRTTLSSKLAGTVVEPGRSVAMFITGAGKVELKAVGERIDGAEVTTITPTGVSLRHRGQIVEMALPKGDKP